MEYTFRFGAAKNSLDALANWDVSKVINMEKMFSSAVNITDLSPLNNWNTASVTNMTDMFKQIPASVTRPNWYSE